MGPTMLATALAEDAARVVPGKTFREAFGDSYLYATNALFRRLRDAALAQGVRYDADAALRLRYAEAPLFLLDEIVAAATIPRFDLRSRFELMENARPGRYRLLQTVGLVNARNPLLHETAHVLAHAVCAEGTADRPPPGDRRFVYGAMLGEAFANAAERLARFAARGDVLSLELQILNAYPSQIDAAAAGAMERLAAAAGPRMLAAATLGGMLLRNFRHPMVVESDAPLAAELAGVPLPAAAHADALAVLRQGLELSAAFVFVTSDIYFGLLGVREELGALLNVHPLEWLRDLPAERTAFTRLLDLLAPA